MPRSKFATKNYGPTKPAICEKQILPPGILRPGPGACNTTYFMLTIGRSGQPPRFVSGQIETNATSAPNHYSGRAQFDEYNIEIEMLWNPEIPRVVWTWTVREQTTIVQMGAHSTTGFRSLDPFDTGLSIVSGPNVKPIEALRTIATS